MTGSQDTGSKDRVALAVWFLICILAICQGAVCVAARGRSLDGQVD